jgi:hypothetical protein
VNEAPENMTTVELSAKHSFFGKRILPFLVLVLAWTYWWRLRHGKPVDLWMVLTVAVTLGAILTAHLWRNLWKMADTVEDLGDQLCVRRWKHTVRLSLREISRVRLEPGPVGQIVALELTRPCALGKEISFYAPSPRKVRTITQDLQSLVARVKAQGRKQC